MNNEDIILYGGTYLNKGGAAIAYGTLEALKTLNIKYEDIIDPEPFFPFKELSLNPIYRYSDILSTKALPSISARYLYKPFFKCMQNTYKSEIKELKGLPIWHIGDSPFSDSRSSLSVVGQIIALESLRRVIDSKVIIGGVSIDAPRTHLGRVTSRKYFKNYYFFVRGKQTFKNLSDLGVPKDNMISICDFAFQLTKMRSSASKGISEIVRESEKPLVALCLRDYAHGELSRQNLLNIKNLVSKLQHGFKVFFIPTTYAYLRAENDYLFVRDILGINEENIINIRDLSPGEIIDVFSNFDAIISSRLHGAVYGALANVPTVHLYESSKSLEVIEEVFGEAIPLIKLSDFATGVGIDEIINRLDKMVKSRDEVANRLKSNIDDARHLSISRLTESFETLLD